MQRLQQRLLSYLINNVAQVAEISPEDVSSSLLGGTIQLSSVRLKCDALNKMLFGDTAAMVELAEGEAGSLEISVPWRVVGGPITASLSDVSISLRLKAPPEGQKASPAHLSREAIMDGLREELVLGMVEGEAGAIADDDDDPPPPAASEGDDRSFASCSEGSGSDDEREASDDGAKPQGWFGMLAATATTMIPEALRVPRPTIIRLRDITMCLNCGADCKIEVALSSVVVTKEVATESKRHRNGRRIQVSTAVKRVEVGPISIAIITADKKATRVVSIPAFDVTIADDCSRPANLPPAGAPPAPVANGTVHIESTRQVVEVVQEVPVVVALHEKTLSALTLALTSLSASRLSVFRRKASAKARWAHLLDAVVADIRTRRTRYNFTHFYVRDWSQRRQKYMALLTRLVDDRTQFDTNRDILCMLEMGLRHRDVVFALRRVVHSAKGTIAAQSTGFMTEAVAAAEAKTVEQLTDGSLLRKVAESGTLRVAASGLEFLLPSGHTMAVRSVSFLTVGSVSMQASVQSISLRTADGGCPMSTREGAKAFQICQHRPEDEVQACSPTASAALFARFEETSVALSHITLSLEGHEVITIARPLMDAAESLLPLIGAIRPAPMEAAVDADASMAPVQQSELFVRAKDTIHGSKLVTVVRKLCVEMQTITLGLGPAVLSLGHVAVTNVTSSTGRGAVLELTTRDCSLQCGDETVIAVIQCSTDPTRNAIQFAPVNISISKVTLTRLQSLKEVMATLVPATAPTSGDAMDMDDCSAVYTTADTASVATGYTRMSVTEGFAQSIQRRRVRAQDLATRISNMIFTVLNYSRRPQRMRLDGVDAFRSLGISSARARHPAAFVFSALRIEVDTVAAISIRDVSVTFHERVEGAYLAAPGERPRRRVIPALLVGISHLDMLLFDSLARLELRNASIEHIAPPRAAAPVIHVLTEALSLNLRSSKEVPFHPEPLTTVSSMRLAACGGHTDFSADYLSICGEGCLLENINLEIVSRAGVKIVDTKPTVGGDLSAKLRLRSLDLRCLDGARFAPAGTILFDHVVPLARLLMTPLAIRLFMSSLTDITLTLLEGPIALTSFNGFCATLDVLATVSDETTEEADVLARTYSEMSVLKPRSNFCSGSSVAGGALGGGLRGAKLSYASKSHSPIRMQTVGVPPHRPQNAQRLTMVMTNDCEDMTQGISLTNLSLSIRVPDSQRTWLTVSMGSLKRMSALAREEYWTDCPPRLSSCETVSCPGVRLAIQHGDSSAEAVDLFAAEVRALEVETRVSNTTSGSREDDELHLTEMLPPAIDERTEADDALVFGASEQRSVESTTTVTAGAITVRCEVTADGPRFAAAHACLDGMIAVISDPRQRLRITPHAVHTLSNTAANAATVVSDTPGTIRGRTFDLAKQRVTVSCRSASVHAQTVLVFEDCVFVEPDDATSVSIELEAETSVVFRRCTFVVPRTDGKNTFGVDGAVVVLDACRWETDVSLFLSRVTANVPSKSEAAKQASTPVSAEPLPLPPPPAEAAASKTSLFFKAAAVDARFLGPLSRSLALVVASVDMKSSREELPQLCGDAVVRVSKQLTVERLSVASHTLDGQKPVIPRCKLSISSEERRADSLDVTLDAVCELDEVTIIPSFVSTITDIQDILVNTARKPLPTGCGGPARPPLPSRLQERAVRGDESVRHEIRLRRGALTMTGLLGAVPPYEQLRHVSVSIRLPRVTVTAFLPSSLPFARISVRDVSITTHRSALQHDDDAVDDAESVHSAASWGNAGSVGSSDLPALLAVSADCFQAVLSLRASVDVYDPISYAWARAVSPAHVTICCARTPVSAVINGKVSPLHMHVTARLVRGLQFVARHWGAAPAAPLPHRVVNATGIPLTLHYNDGKSCALPAFNQHASTQMLPQVDAVTLGSMRRVAIGPFAAMPPPLDTPGVPLSDGKAERRVVGPFGAEPAGTLLAQRSVVYVGDGIQIMLDRTVNADFCEVLHVRSCFLVENHSGMAFCFLPSSGLCGADGKSVFLDVPARSRVSVPLWLIDDWAARVQVLDEAGDAECDLGASLRSLAQRVVSGTSVSFSTRRFVKGNQPERFASLTVGVDKATQVATLHLHHATAGIANNLRFALQVSFTDADGAVTVQTADAGSTVWSQQHNPQKKQFAVLEVVTPAGLYRSDAIPIHPASVLSEITGDCRLHRVADTPAESPTTNGFSFGVASFFTSGTASDRDYIQVKLLSGVDGSMPTVHVAPHPDWAYLLNRSGQPLRLEVFDETDPIAGIGTHAVPPFAAAYLRTDVAYMLRARDTHASAPVTLESQLQSAVCVCKYTKPNAILAEQFIVRASPAVPAPSSALHVDPELLLPLADECPSFEVLPMFVFRNRSEQAIVVEHRARSQTSNQCCATQRYIVKGNAIGGICRIADPRKYVDEFRIALHDAAQDPTRTGFSRYVAVDYLSDFRAYPLTLPDPDGPPTHRVLHMVRPTPTGPTEFHLGLPTQPHITIINSTDIQFAECEARSAAVTCLPGVHSHMLLHDKGGGGGGDPVVYSLWLEDSTGPVPIPRVPADAFADTDALLTEIDGDAGRLLYLSSGTKTSTEAALPFAVVIRAFDGVDSVRRFQIIILSLRGSLGTQARPAESAAKSSPPSNSDGFAVALAVSEIGLILGDEPREMNQKSQIARLQISRLLTNFKINRPKVARDTSLVMELTLQKLSIVDLTGASARDRRDVVAPISLNLGFTGNDPALENHELRAHSITLSCSPASLQITDRLVAALMRLQTSITVQDRPKRVLSSQREFLSTWKSPALTVCPAQAPVPLQARPPVEFISVSAFSIAPLELAVSFLRTSPDIPFDNSVVLFLLNYVQDMTVRLPEVHREDVRREMAASLRSAVISAYTGAMWSQWTGILARVGSNMASSWFSLFRTGRAAGRGLYGLLGMGSTESPGTIRGFMASVSQSVAALPLSPTRDGTAPALTDSGSPARLTRHSWLCIHCDEINEIAQQDHFSIDAASVLLILTRFGPAALFHHVTAAELRHAIERCPSVRPGGPAIYTMAGIQHISSLLPVFREAQLRAQGHRLHRSRSDSFPLLALTDAGSPPSTPPAEALAAGDTGCIAAAHMILSSPPAPRNHAAVHWENTFVEAFLLAHVLDEAAQHL